MSTRIDTSPRGIWHGRIKVRRQAFNGKPFALAGTFAGSWCGMKRS